MNTCITFAAFLIALSIVGLAVMVRVCLENLTHQVKIIREDLKRWHERPPLLRHPGIKNPLLKSFVEQQRELTKEIEKEGERISTPIRRYRNSAGEGIAAATDRRKTETISTPTASGGQFSVYRDPASGPDGSVPFCDTPEAGNQ